MSTLSPHDGPTFLPFTGPVAGPHHSVVAVACVPEPGVYDLYAEVWDHDAVCPHPTFLYEPTGKLVSWRLVNRVTGEELVLAPSFRAAPPAATANP